MNNEQLIVKTTLQHLPQAQAIYFFGSWGTGDEWPESDIDLAVLLPPRQARVTGSLSMNDLRFELEALLNKEVDLINLRQVSTVFQKEIITTGRRVFCADENGTDEFEMIALSLYQKLNEERAGILEDALNTGRFFNL